MQEGPCATKKGNKLSIQLCESFLNDKRFDTLKATLHKQAANLLSDWQNLAVEAAKFDPKTMNIMTERDNICFLDDRFELVVDVRGLPPENIQCMVTDMTIEVDATKSIKNQSGTGYTEQTQTLNRRYMLPQRVDATKGTCMLSNEGILMVTAPWIR